MHSLKLQNGHIYLNNVDIGTPTAAITLFPHLITQIQDVVAKGEKEGKATAIF